MNFVENIVHLLQNCNFCFHADIPFSHYCNRKGDIAITRQFFEYLADKIFKFEFIFDGQTPPTPNLNEFNGYFPGILDRFNFLSLMGARDLDNGGIDILINWLTKQSNNEENQQKIIELRSPFDLQFKTIYNRIKEVN